MMVKAIFSIKTFAKANKKISAYSEEAQEKFYTMNLDFKRRSFRYFSSLNQLVNKTKTEPRKYPLMIGVGKYDNNMAIKAAEMWAKWEPKCDFIIFDKAGHIVNMDIPEEFNSKLDEFLKKYLYNIPKNEQIWFNMRVQAVSRHQQKTLLIQMKNR